MKGTVAKRLDICYYFGTFYTILNFYFRIVVPSATQHTKFLTSFTLFHCSPIERFPNGCRKTKTKAITPTNHTRSRQRDEPITIPSNYL